MFISLMKLHNFICNNTENSLKYFIRAVLPGGHDHNTSLWLTLCTIDDTVERVLLGLCICVYMRVHLCTCVGEGGGCMLAMSTSVTGPLYGVIDK